VFGKTLQSDGFATVGDLAAADMKDLVKRYGETGLRLHDLAHGRDNRPVRPEHDRKGMSAETTFNDRPDDGGGSGGRALAPVREAGVQGAPRRRGQPGRGAQAAPHRLQDRHPPDHLPEPIQTARALFAAGRDLLMARARPPLSPDRHRHGGGGRRRRRAPPLFETTESRALKTETTIDKLRAKFGKDAVVAGRALKR
jgi:DNA polymerase-4